MATEAPGQSNEQKRLLPFRSHVAIALLFGLLVILYTAGVVLGFVGEGRKIDAVNLALIALAVLWAILLLRPEVFARVQRFEMTGFKLEMRTVVEQLDERITNFLVSSMSADIFHRLCGIAILIKYEYQHKYFEREMYWLKDNGFIKTKPPNTDREFYGGIDGKNLAEMWEPTEVGWFAVRLRKKEIPPDLLKDPINLKIDPSTL